MKLLELEFKGSAQFRKQLDGLRVKQIDPAISERKNDTRSVQNLGKFPFHVAADRCRQFRILALTSDN